MTYQLQPGTIAFRAVEWLKRQPEATQVTSSVWGEALGVDGNTLSVCIKQAVEEGIVKKATKGGLAKPFWFSLGDGVPLARPDDDDDDHTEPGAEAAADAAVVAAPVPAPAPSPTPAPSPAPKPRAPAAAPAKAPPAPPLEPRLTPEQYVRRIGVEQEKPEAEAVPFNACRYVDGSVIVVGVQVREDGAIIFAPKQAQALWRLRDAA